MKKGVLLGNKGIGKWDSTFKNKDNKIIDKTLRNGLRNIHLYLIFVLISFPVYTKYIIGSEERLSISVTMILCILYWCKI